LFYVGLSQFYHSGRNFIMLTGADSNFFYFYILILVYWILYFIIYFNLLYIELSYYHNSGRCFSILIRVNSNYFLILFFNINLLNIILICFQYLKKHKKKISIITFKTNEKKTIVVKKEQELSVFFSNMKR
jgi:hypothetical protein